MGNRRTGESSAGGGAKAAAAIRQAAENDAENQVPPRPEAFAERPELRTAYNEAYRRAWLRMRGRKDG